MFWNYCSLHVYNSVTIITYDLLVHIHNSIIHMLMCFLVDVLEENGWDNLLLLNIICNGFSSS